MDQNPTAQSVPVAWAKQLEQGHADVAAGRVAMIDTDALCREIEVEVDALAGDIAARHVSNQ